MTMTDDERTRKCEIECTDLTNNAEAWTNEEISAIERESIEYWAKIEDPERRAMAVIARDCLIRLMENPTEWLPTSLKPESGARLGLFIFISIDEVEEQVVEMRQHAEQELYNQIQGIAGLKADLSADGSPAPESSEEDTE